MERGLITSAFLVMLCLESASAFGEAGWTSFSQVAELTSTSQYRYLVTLKIQASPSGCRNRVVFYQDQGSPGSEQMFRILLEAVSSSKPVKVYVTGNCDLNGYSEISAVTITP